MNEVLVSVKAEFETVLNLQSEKTNSQTQSTLFDDHC